MEGCSLGTPTRMVVKSSLLVSCLFFGYSVLGQMRGTVNSSDAVQIVTYLYNLEASVPFPPPSIEELEQGEREYIKPVIQPYEIDSIRYAVVQSCIYDDLSDLEFDDFSSEKKALAKAFVRGQGECVITKQNFQLKNGEAVPFVSDNFSREAIAKVKTKYNVLGILSYSQIAFNGARDKAMLCFGVTRAGLDSHFGVYFFEKKHNQWKLSDSITISSS